MGRRRAVDDGIHSIVSLFFSPPLSPSSFPLVFLLFSSSRGNPLWPTLTKNTYSLVACQSGGYTHPWSSAYVLCLLLFGIAAIAAFVIYELFVPAYPLLPRELLRRKTIPVAFVVAFVSGMYYYGLTNFGPIYFSNVYASDPLTIGLRNTPFPTMVLAGAITGNFLISRFPRHIAYIMAGYSALTS